MVKISNSLARSFAKAVIIQNGNDNTSKTMYGTVVQDEGVNYVQIDGSTELTPFSSVMDAVPGNRVSVTIDKGKATIVGNVSAPAQNTANFPEGSVNTACLYGPIDGDTLTIKNINASNIKSGTIDASLITVTNIDADSIKAGAITTDKLDANAVTAAKIASNAITTDKLDANAVTAAKIASNAVTADKIKAGEITSNHISTGGLSASVIESTSLNTAIGNIITSTVDTSFIRNLVAGDITALGVSSQSMIIGSGDYGTVEIDGTLLQFKDNTQNHNVYIQLGKDAQGNNSLIIKNQNGNTIINSSGVTANAIANELIVDSMVKKRDANYTGISANALNIDSVVTGINNGSSTINTSKIYFDEGSQTLNTKLSSMTSSISGINTNLNTNYYTKTETNNQVSSIIGSTTINRNGTDVNMLSALNSVIDTAEGHTQTISGINSSIGSLTTRMSTAESKITDSAIVNTVRSNLRIGGRNLLLNSDTRQLIPNPSSGNKKPTINYQTGQTVSEWDATDAIRAYGSLATTATSIIFGALRNSSGQPNRECVLDTPYVGSIYIKNNHATNLLRVNINYIDRVNPVTGVTDGGVFTHIYNPDSGEDTDITDIGAGKFVVRPGKIVKVVLTGYGSNASGGGIRALQIGFEAESTSVGEFDFTYWHPQIEEGHIASDWSPSPIDTARQSTVEQLDDKISMIVDGTSTASSVVLTQNALTAIANNIDLSGKVTFNSLTTQAKADIASDTLSNIYSNGTTTIDGGKITASSITANKINVSDLFSQNITASGTISGVNITGASGEFTKDFSVSVPVVDTSGFEIVGYVTFDPTNALFRIACEHPEYRNNEPDAPHWGSISMTDSDITINHKNTVLISSEIGRLRLLAPHLGIYLGGDVDILGGLDISGGLTISGTVQGLNIGDQIKINGTSGANATKILTSTSSGAVFNSLYDLAVTEGNGTFSNTTISPGSWSKIGTFTIPKGKYLIITQADISTASGGTYTNGVVGLGINTGTSTKTSYARFDSKVNCNAGSVYLQNIRVGNYSSSRDINLWVHSTMANAISVDAGFMYLELPG